MNSRLAIKTKIGVVALMVLFTCVGASAQVDIGTYPDEYRSAAEKAWPIVKPFAESLFYLLALIQITWAAITLALEKADLQGWVVGLIRQVFFIGLGAAILYNAQDWMWAIFKSFTDLGAMVNPKTLQPGDVFGYGITIAKEISTTSVGWDIPLGLSYLLASLVIVFAFSFMAITMLLALIEGVIAVVLGQILLGFAGSKWTIGYTEKYLGMIINVGLKVFTTYFMAGIAVTIVQGWLNTMKVTDGWSVVQELVGGSLILAAVVYAVPKFVSMVIGGAPSLGFSDASAVTAGAATALGTAVGGAINIASKAGSAIGGAASGKNSIASGAGAAAPASGPDGKAVSPPNSPSGYSGGSAANAWWNASRSSSGGAPQSGAQSAAESSTSGAVSTPGPTPEQSGAASKPGGPDLIATTARQIASAGGMSQFVPSAVGSASSLGGRNDGGQGMPGSESAVPPPSTAGLSSRSDAGVSGSAPVGIGGAAAEALSAPAGMTTSTPMSPGGSESIAGLGGGSAASATASPTPSDRAPIGSGGVESAGASAAAATAAFGSVGAMTGTSSSAGAPAPTAPAAPQREHMPGIKDDYERMDAANRKNKLLLDQRNSSVRPGSRPPSRPKP